MTAGKEEEKFYARKREQIFFILQALRAYWERGG